MGDSLSALSPPRWSVLACSCPCGSCARLWALCVRPAWCALCLLRLCGWFPLGGVLVVDHCLNQAFTTGIILAARR